MYMYTYVYIHVYIYIYTYICLYTEVYIHTHIDLRCAGVSAGIGRGSRAENWPQLIPVVRVCCLQVSCLFVWLFVWLQRDALKPYHGRPPRQSILLLLPLLLLSLLLLRLLLLLLLLIILITYTIATTTTANNNNNDINNNYTELPRLGRRRTPSSTRSSPGQSRRFCEHCVTILTQLLLPPPPPPPPPLLLMLIIIQIMIMVFPSRKRQPHTNRVNAASSTTYCGRDPHSVRAESTEWYFFVCVFVVAYCMCVHVIGCLV